MNILIPGGSGLLGQALSVELLAKGHQVTILSRGSQPETAEGPKLVTWDGRSATGWGQLVEETDAIINLAGASIGAGRWTAQRKRSILESRVNAGKAVLSAVAAAKHKPALVIQASGIGAYGPGDDRLMDESTPFGSDFLSTVCVQWEASSRGVVGFGMRQAVIRTGLVMTPTGGWMTQLLLAYRLFAGGPFGSGKQWWPWIHMQDYVRGVCHLLEDEKAGGVYNLVGPNPCRMADFGRTLAAVLRRPYWLPVPGFGLQLLLGEMSVLILEGQRAVPSRLVETGFKFKFEQLRPALEDLFGSR